MKNNKKSNPIEFYNAGTYTTKAHIDGDIYGGDPLKEGLMIAQLLNPFQGELLLDVVAKDTYSGEMVTLVGVPFKKPKGAMSAGISPNTVFDLTAPNYEMFIKKRTSTMNLVETPESPTYRNTAIPEPIKQRSSGDMYATERGFTCQKFDQVTNTLKEKKGLIFDRDDITVMQGKKDGNSGGVIVHNESGELWLFDETGQYQLMKNGNLLIKTRTHDIESAQRSRQLDPDKMGLYVQDTAELDTLPAGTILTPAPNVLPDFWKIATTIMDVIDLCDLVITLGIAVAEAFDD